MARKKEQAVMETVSDEVEFVSFIDKPGLNVIDVYQTWCGPCKSIQGMTSFIQGGRKSKDLMHLDDPIFRPSKLQLV